MKFINNGEPIKIRIGNLNRCYWNTVKHGEIIDLSLARGSALGLTLITTKGQIGDKVVETKQIETVTGTVEGTDDYTPDDLFFKELKAINGIGKKTAEDIVDWGTKEKLIEAIKKEEKLPFRDDIELKLREHYGN